MDRYCQGKSHLVSIYVPHVCIRANIGIYRYNFKRLTVEAEGHSAPMMLYVMGPEETCIHHNLPNGGVLCNLYVTFTPSNVEYNYLITYITILCNNVFSRRKSRNSCNWNPSITIFHWFCKTILSLEFCDLICTTTKKCKKSSFGEGSSKFVI
jgi:hypothetical protein